MKKLTGVLCILISSAVLSGCGNGAEQKMEENGIQSEQTESRNDNAERPTGQGFTPPKGSRVDKKGRVVDPEGNTFRKDGSWDVPEGGHMDEEGHIYDRDGNIMGGGAVAGSKG